jgi:anti-sigma factor RsiW
MGIDELADEMLMAYADGELDAAAAHRIEAAMAADARVASRVVAFQRTRRLARAAFATPDEVPEALRRAVEDQIRAVSGTPEREAVVVPFPTRAAVPTRSWANRAMAAAAVAAAVVASGVIGFYVAGSPGPGATAPALAAVSPEVAKALSTVASGETVAVPGGDLRLVQTFAAGDGALCREFQLAGPAESASAVACRGAEAWQVRFAAVTPSTDGGDYRPASGDELLDGFLAGIGAGEVLDPAAEKAALDAIR